ncbi:Uncharacterized protein Adt_09124 [Abeliophyllum distichum]|uniref:Uncharacterized protein n=1 Tax=Abeliophyllum distichum TaxID=126358 RepID=A0ABD1UGB5_9LAMI
MPPMILEFKQVTTRRRFSTKSISKTERYEAIKSREKEYSINHSVASHSRHPTAFGLAGCNPITYTGPSFSYQIPLSYSVFPPHPANSFRPLMYWPPPNVLYLCQSFHLQAYYSQFRYNALVPEMSENTQQNDVVSEDAEEYDSSSSSSSTELQQEGL